MRRCAVFPLIAAVIFLAVAVKAGSELPAIAVDYPSNESIFPPEITPPTFLWRDPAKAASWRIDVAFADRSPALHLTSAGPPMQIGEIDERCIAPTNELPKLSPKQAEAHTWKPDVATWTAIKNHSQSGAAVVTIAGITGDRVVSHGEVTIHTAKDPVGAPIFYRDVPLMPSETEKGVIKPLGAKAVPLIAWRLRNIAETSSRVLMTGLHTCANCHSFSRDGKTLGLDLDGPQNDKGLYAIVPIAKQMAIRNEDVIAWSSFRGKLGSQAREGFMSQVSPDGQYVMTTVKPPGDAQELYYVANFKDYRFLQVFYPTRGILVWYNRRTKQVQPLPGADDPRYAHANAVWSPDGKFLVFARAEARPAYPTGLKLATYAGDPNETPIQYDLYRIPFNGGRGGKAEPIAGASANGMSNSFPKISPDGRWIVFVQARNGQLMRPDGQLYMVPVEGGKARHMNCNTPLMNSWHSFSPNGRWMVFSSKSWGPYTRMFLTHIDENGVDSPAILIDNPTAANRAVNLPEFVNIPPDGMLKIDTPATEFYRLFDVAKELADKHDYDAAIPAFQKALALSPEDVRGNTNLANALTAKGRLDEAIVHYQAALRGNPRYLEARTNLGAALAQQGRLDEAISHYEQALAVDVRYPEAQADLGVALFRKGNLDGAVEHLRTALEVNPAFPEAHANLGVALMRQGKTHEAIGHFEKALKLDPENAEAQTNFGAALAETGKLDEAIPHFEKALALNANSAELHANLGAVLSARNRYDEAIPHFEKALALTPDSPQLETSLGAALVQQGRPADGAAHFRKALTIAPDFAEARYYLGNAFYLQGKTAEALVEWRTLLRAHPDHVGALNQAAWVLATNPQASVRNGADAVSFAEHASQVSHGQPRILATLAASYAEAGQFPKALETARQALEAATRRNDRQLAQGLNAMIELYAARKPFRDAR